MRRALLVLCALWLAVVPAHAAILIEKWIKTPGGSPDGTAIGDVDGDGYKEIAVVLRGGAFNAGVYTPNTGSMAVLNGKDGSVRFQVSSTKQLAGFPTFADFDGDSFDEVAFCEVSDTGKCYVYDGNGSMLFATPALYYPAMTNGGPVAADINGDGYQDLIVASSAGEVKAFYGPTGTLAWSYDLYATRGDYPFGHVSVADIDGDKKLEIAIGGAQKGGIYILNAENGTEQWVAANLYGTYQNYFLGSGPILMNIDADPALEVVASMAGYPGPAAVIAYDTNGTFKWRTTVASDPLQYTSPAAADTDGDGLPEIFVQGYNGTLFKFKASDGTLITSKALGGNSWASPAFVDTNFDGNMEVVTSTLSSTYILDKTLAQIDRYDNPNSGLFPPPVFADTDANGTLDMVTGAWYPQQLVSISLPYTSAYSWSTFEGSARHTGAAPVASPEALLGSNGATATVVIMNEMVNAVAATSGTQQTNLKTARDDMDQAYRNYLRGNPHTAVDYLRQAVVAIEAAKTAGYPAASVAHLEQEVSYDGILLFSQYIARTQAIVGTSPTAVTTANTALTNAQTQYTAATYSTAITTAANGAIALRSFLDNGPYTVGSYCPAAVSEIYMAWECRINAARASVQALLVTYPGDTKLTNASNSLLTCVEWAPDLVFSNAYPACKSADNYLSTFTKADVSGIRNSIAFAIMRNTRLFIDDATIWFRSVDAAAITYAEGQYNTGVTQYNAASYQSAHTSFANAYTGASPCTGSSFATPANGLTNGGCSP